jgi:hypothetical protein
LQWVLTSYVPLPEDVGDLMTKLSNHSHESFDDYYNTQVTNDLVIDHLNGNVNLIMIIINVKLMVM